jgi:hypothetical protein
MRRIMQTVTRKGALAGRRDRKRLALCCGAALCLSSIALAAPPAAQPVTPAQAAAQRRLETSELQAQGLLGDDANASTAPAPRNADGHPDFSGFWKGSKATKPVGNIGKDLPNFKLPLTPAGEAALKHNLTRTVDPESRCLIGGIPRHDASALPFSIVQNKDHVTWLYLYTYFRSVPFDVRAHEEDPDPRYFGDEIGWWEGDTFVVDSIGFKSSNMWIDENANPQSEALHAVERWSRPDAGHIHVDVTITDPKYYTRPFKYSRTWIGADPKGSQHEYVCSENNADLKHLGPGPGGIRADGTRGYDVAPLPDVPPGPDAYGK